MILWAAFVFYLSSKPGLKISENFFWDFATRKPAHIFVYFIFYLLAAFAFKNSFLKNMSDIIISSFILTIFYGTLDEIHQSFVPLREGKVLDIMWDAIGGLIAAVVLWRYYQNLQLKQRSLE